NYPDRVRLNMLQARSHSDLMTKITRETDARNSRIMTRCLENQFEAPICAPVVDKKYVNSRAAHPRKPFQSCEQMRHHRFFIVAGDHQSEQRIWWASIRHVEIVMGG